MANLSKSAEEIFSTLETLVESFDMKEEYVRKKMAEWSGLFERLEGLMTNVTDASKTANNAIDRGEETLREAKGMLERLKVTFRLRRVAYHQFKLMICNEAERLHKAEWFSASQTCSVCNYAHMWGLWWRESSHLPRITSSRQLL